MMMLRRRARGFRHIDACGARARIASIITTVTGTDTGTGTGSLRSKRRRMYGPHDAPIYAKKKKKRGGVNK
jgi:hypothetical protein